MRYVSPRTCHKYRAFEDAGQCRRFCKGGSSTYSKRKQACSCDGGEYHTCPPPPDDPMFVLVPTSELTRLKDVLGGLPALEPPPPPQGWAWDDVQGWAWGPEELPPCRYARRCRKECRRGHGYMVRHSPTTGQCDCADGYSCKGRTPLA